MTNPFTSPQSADSQSEAQPPITATKAIALAAGCALAGGGAGAALGFALAKVAPGYYRSVFSSGDRPDFDPEAVGLGLGATQGVVAGLLVGLAIACMLAWFNSRRGPASKA